MAEENYCVFMDILGYHSMVYDNTMPISKVENELNSIYLSIAFQLKTGINWYYNNNPHISDKIVLRSFSDSIYFQCKRLEPILYVCNFLFNWIFAYYQASDLNLEWCPTIRCGIVKDWTTISHDVGGIVNNQKDINIIGRGVARAYETSERSGFSGMRIIISPEILDELKCMQVSIMNKKYFELRTIFGDYYFKHLLINRDGRSVNYYELLWPYYSMLRIYTTGIVETLEKLKLTFKGDSKKHFYATLEIVYESYLLADNKYNLKSWLGEYYLNKLQELIKK